jgi:hypothetical protein
MGGTSFASLFRPVRLVVCLGAASAATALAVAGFGSGSIVNAVYSPPSQSQASLVSINVHPIGPVAGGNLLTIGGTEADPGNGSGHGHVTALAVYNNEIYGVDSSGSTGDALAPLENAALTNPVCYPNPQQANLCVALLPMKAGPGFATFEIASASFNDLGWSTGLNVGQSVSALDNPDLSKCQGAGAFSQLLEAYGNTSSPPAFAFLQSLGSSSYQNSCPGFINGGTTSWVLNGGPKLPPVGCPSVPAILGVAVSTCNSSTHSSGGATTNSSSALLVLLPVGDASIGSSSATGPG